MNQSTVTDQTAITNLVYDAIDHTAFFENRLELQGADMIVGVVETDDGPLRVEITVSVSR